MNATTTNKITVKYWIGTNQHTATAKNYRGAMRIAARNQNAYGPRFYDANGDELHDDGNGLATEADMANGQYSF